MNHPDDATALHTSAEAAEPVPVATEEAPPLVSESMPPVDVSWVKTTHIHGSDGSDHGIRLSGPVVEGGE